jgi:hypothetical protein
MPYLPLLGAAAALALAGLLLRGADGTEPPAAAVPTAPAAPPVAAGHHVLVVEGDRNALAITAASAKTDPWAGVPAGFTSDWRLLIADDRGATLAEVPLDVRPFATGAADVGSADRVQGCIVTTARIGMLVNAPAFATAATYTFVRPGDGGRDAVLGTVTAARVRELAGGGR